MKKEQEKEEKQEPKKPATPAQRKRSSREGPSPIGALRNLEYATLTLNDPQARREERRAETEQPLC